MKRCGKEQTHSRTKGSRLQKGGGGRGGEEIIEGVSYQDAIASPTFNYGEQSPLQNIEQKTC